MHKQPKPIIAFAFFLFAVSASADPLVYVIGAAGTSNQGQFGTIDIKTGAFQQIGPSTPGLFGLGAGPNGSLVSLTYSGDFDSINPATGMTAFIGKTGLDNCVAPGSSPCGPNSANLVGVAAGNIYATDFQNNLYRINPITGAATLIGRTGIPAIPFIPTTLNPDGSINLYDETLLGMGGKLYATFDAFTFDFNSNALTSVVVAPELYQIDPATGLTTVIGPTDLGIGGAVDVNGTTYEFNDLTGQIDTLDLSNGKTTFVSNFDPAAGVIQGAAAVPEPTPIALAAIGILLTAFSTRRMRRRGRSLLS